MKRINDIYFSSEIILMYIVLMPIFTFSFLIGYKPFNLNSVTNMSIGRFAFIVAMIMCIEAVTVMISRIILLAFRHRNITMLRYISWDIAETVVFLLFTNLFIWLITNRIEPYFVLLPSVLLYGFCILVFPHAMIILIAENKSKTSIIEEKDQIIEKFEAGLTDDKKKNIHFTDEKGHLKLLVSSDSILYIEGADNYVQICYLKTGKMTRFCLRNTMRGIEDICLKSDLIRCHRSYFLNLKKVKILQKDRDGLSAELEYADAPRIPVSKTYCNQVIDKFSSLGN